MKLTVMVGLPGAGKSFWIAENKGTSVVVSLDWIRRNIFGHQFHRPAEHYVIGTAKSCVELLLAQHQDVIVDSTALTRGIRQEWIDLARKHGAPTDIVYISTPYQACLKRNAERCATTRVPDETMQTMMQMFGVPHYSDYTAPDVKVVTV